MRRREVIGLLYAALEGTTNDHITGRVYRILSPWREASWVSEISIVELGTRKQPAYTENPTRTQTCALLNPAPPG
jgi:hypothetical protein